MDRGATDVSTQADRAGPGAGMGAGAMSGAPSDPSTADAARSPGAQRMARHRQRRRNGLRSVTVDLRESEIDQLIRCRLLAPASRADPFALRKAIHGLLDQVFR